MIDQLRHGVFGAAAALFLAFVMIAVPQPAAAFGDCESADYLAGFGAEEVPAPAMSTGCVVAFNIPYSSPEGERRIRAIHDLSAGWAVSGASLAALEEGVRNSIAAFASLGSYAIDDVTILILEDTALRLSDPTSSGDGMLAGTDSYRRADGARRGECFITIFALQAVGMDPANTGYVIAHELFHCIQGATLSAAQMQTATSEGAWWAEGSAELFASVAIPGIGDLAGRSRRFVTAVDERMPLYDLSYSMAVFFWWYESERGMSALIPFLRQMSGTNSDAAQRAAMRNVMPQADWLRFVQAYVDHEITTPQGGGLTFLTDEGEAHEFDENRTVWLTLDPFVVTQGVAQYRCGEWRNEGAPEEDSVSARKAEGRDWGRYPAEVDARESRSGRYRIAAINSEDGCQRVRIEAEQRAGCGPCAGSDRVDACLAGTWVQSGGGAVEWMRAQGMPITSATVGEQIITYRGDGSYRTVPFSAEMVTEMRSRRGRTIGEGDGVAGAAGGRWSADEGMLNVCQDSGGVTGTVTVTSPHGTGTIPINVPGGGVLNMSYSCSESTLQTSLTFGSMPPMVTKYSKLSVEPPEDEAPEPPPPSGGGEGSHLSGGGGACPSEDPDPLVEDECDRLRR